MEVVASLSQGRTAAAQCDLFTYKSVPVIFEPPCISRKETSVTNLICGMGLCKCVQIQERTKIMFNIYTKVNIIPDSYSNISIRNIIY